MSDVTLRSLNNVFNRKARMTTEGFLQVGRAEFLKAKPVRNPELRWRQDKKGIRLTLPRKRTIWFRFFSKFLPLKREQLILLDEQGALVWSLCNGEHQVKEIAKRLSQKYDMRTSDAQAALDLYLVQLSKNGLLGFILPESAKKRYHRSLDSSKTDKKSRK